MYSLPSFSGQSLLGGAGIGAMPSLFSIGNQGISAGFDRMQQAMQEVTRLLHDSNERRKDRKAQEDAQKRQQKQQKKLFGQKAAVGAGVGLAGGALVGAVAGPALTAGTATAGPAVEGTVAAGAGDVIGTSGGTALTAGQLSSVGGGLTDLSMGPMLGSMATPVVSSTATVSSALSPLQGALLGGALGGLTGLPSAYGVDAGIPTPMQTFSAMGQAQRMNSRAAGSVNPLDTPIGGGTTYGQMFPGAGLPESLANEQVTHRGMGTMMPWYSAQLRGVSSQQPQGLGLSERLNASGSPGDMASTVYQYYMDNPKTPIGPALSAWEGIKQFPGYESAPFPFKYDETAGGWPTVKGGMERQVNPAYWQWYQEELKRRRGQQGPPSPF